MLLANTVASPSVELFQSVLEETEVGVCVVDSASRAIYMNASARRLLECADDHLPEWAADYLAPMMLQIRTAGAQSLEKWAHGGMVLRVRVRRLDFAATRAVLEITVAQSAADHHLSDLLARGLDLSITDARLLSLLWRGMSNDEIARTLGVRVGTVKSRLFRLYQKLGVKRRPAAVLRAAEILS